MIKPAYSVSFLLSINIFVWQNVLYFLDAPRILQGAKENTCTSEEETRRSTGKLHNEELVICTRQWSKCY